MTVSGKGRVVGDSGSTPHSLNPQKEEHLMARSRQQNSRVCARDAIVVVVGARPIRYGKMTVIDRRTQEEVEIDNHNVIEDEGDEGVPYAFKAFQKVDRRHPAVEAAPQSFIELDEVDAADLAEVEV